MSWNIVEMNVIQWSKCDRCGKVNPSEIHTCTPIEVKESITELTDVKLVIYCAALAGLIAQGKPISPEQTARNALEYANEAMKIWR